MAQLVQIKEALADYIARGITGLRSFSTEVAPVCEAGFFRAV